MLHPQEVKPGTVGVFFLIAADDKMPEGPYVCHFFRVRVVMNNVHMGDMRTIAEYAAQLNEHKQPYMAFVGGRDVPLPTSDHDTAQLTDDMARVTKGRMQ